MAKRRRRDIPADSECFMMNLPVCILRDRKLQEILITKAETASGNDPCSVVSVAYGDLFLFLRQVFLVDRGYHYVIGIDHFVEMDFRDLGEKLISVEL